MPTHSFTITLAGVDVITDAMANALHDAGCADGTPVSSEGTAAVLFTRDGPSLGDAVGSAIRDVEKAGLRVARIEVES